MTTRKKNYHVRTNQPKYFSLGPRLNQPAQECATKTPTRSSNVKQHGTGAAGGSQKDLGIAKKTPELARRSPSPARSAAGWTGSVGRHLLHDIVELRVSLLLAGHDELRQARGDAGLLLDFRRQRLKKKKNTRGRLKSSVE